VKTADELLNKPTRVRPFLTKSGAGFTCTGCCGRMWETLMSREVSFAAALAVTRETLTDDAGLALKIRAFMWLPEYRDMTKEFGHD